MINLSDEQIARLFALTEEIAAIKGSIPTPPSFMRLHGVQEEIARASRETLEQHTAALEEMSRLLRNAFASMSVAPGPDLR